jgi:hypothetical protein
MEKEYPMLIAFPFKEGMVKVWCPWCVCWHIHTDSRSIVGKGLEHRVAHCGTIGENQRCSAFHTTGYYLRHATKAEMKWIGNCNK